MPLETERDLRLALPAEANDLLEVLIRITIEGGFGRQKHFVTLLEDRGRLNLVHEAVFALKSFTNWTFHRGNSMFSPIFGAVKPEAGPTCR
jgi:hypothetical protein